MSTVTTHVLDTGRGLPATDVVVRLERSGGAVLGECRTDEDGRARELGPDRLDTGGYRLVFDTGGYFHRLGTPCFYPEVSISFTVTDGEHYHVPLLLSAFGYSTYRGS